MGKLNFSKPQQLVFDEASRNQFFRDQFYFTGGSALSVFYLAHRASEDMDFFSEKDFDDGLVYSFVRDTARKLGFQERFTQQERTRTFDPKLVLA